MRVRNKVLLLKLCDLKLDRQSFGLAKDWMATTERLKSAEQTCLFLRRCLKENVTPTSFRRPCRIPQDLQASSSISKLQTNLSRKLIRISIRQKYRDIAVLKETSKIIREKIQLNEVEELIERISEETKISVKSSLIKKFNWLRKKPQHQPKERGYQKTQSNGDRVSIIGNIDVAEEAIETLAKGPSFAISKQITKEELQKTVQVEVAALAYALRWKAAVAESAERREAHDVAETHTPTNISRECPFKPKRIAPPRTSMDAESAIRGFLTDMERIVSRTRCNVRPNIDRQERGTVVELARRSEITITRSDKGGEIVVMRTKELHDLNMEHLNDTSTYERLKKDPTQSLRTVVNKTLRDVMTQRNFSPSLIQRLQTPPTARTQQFYALPKTHKETLKIRPIVSGRNGIFDRIGWFLQLLLKPLLRNVEAHINNTTDLIKKFQDCPRSTLKGKIPVSLDVVSLYTNIDIEEAISTTMQSIQTHGTYLYGLTTGDLNDLLHLILENNTFEYPGYGFYKQIRGLAMGSRLSGTLAILTMDRFERLHIYRKFQPAIYTRYVDDTGTVVNSPNDAQRMVQYLNNQHTTIKFELELPREDGYLPLLDTAMKINPDGSLSYKLYSKPASKRITLHHDSHHPGSTKKAIIDNEMRRALQNSSAENSAAAIRETTQKLINNGYPADSVKRAFRKGTKPSTREKSNQQLTFRFPFISDRLDAQIRRSLECHNINARLSHPRPQTLLQLAQPRVQPPTCNLRNCPIPYLKCMTSYIVYEVTCCVCKESYIGSTSRPLHTRAKEHIAAAKKEKRHNRSR